MVAPTKFVHDFRILLAENEAKTCFIIKNRPPRETESGIFYFTECF